jgi:hypothetical protein
MTAYCLEYGRPGIIIHQLSCESIDLASLMGQGNICSLGNFDGSLPAFIAARLTHPEASRCVDCCKDDLPAATGEAKFIMPQVFSHSM